MILDKNKAQNLVKIIKFADIVTKYNSKVPSSKSFLMKGLEFAITDIGKPAIRNIEDKIEIFPSIGYKKKRQNILSNKN